MMHPLAIIPVALLALALGASTAHGQATASAADPRPTATAARRTGPVMLDGVPGEAAWAAAEAVTAMRQQLPRDGTPFAGTVDIRMLYDDVALYVGARIRSPGGVVVAPLTRHDQVALRGAGIASDALAIVLDPFRDRSTQLWFEINPAGVRGDHQDGDASWDPVWEGAARTDSGGWSAELRIPFSQLRFGVDSVQRWGMQLWLYTGADNGLSMWAYWRRNEPGGSAFFGALDGIRVARAPRQRELLPFVAVRRTHAPQRPGDPFNRAVETAPRAGADVKASLPSGLVLDATVAPDFGQVEADPAVVNLSAFETQFAERRPFFVANAGAFASGAFSCFLGCNTSSLNLFYSRRIGRAPQLASVVGASAAYIDAAEAAQILAAGKVTGRTPGGWTVGLLSATTRRETARLQARPGAPTEVHEVEPLSSYAVGRVQRDVRGGETRVGAIATLARRFTDDSLVRSRLRTGAGVAGVDLTHYWGQRRYSLLMQAAVSDVAGDTAAMRRTQESSARYFQRPGRETVTDGLFDVSYDPARTRLRGYAAYLRIAKDAGDWAWETTQNWRSPGFEVNDLAFMGRADYGFMNANVRRRWTRPKRWYRDAGVTVGAEQQVNYEGDRIDAQGHARFDMTFPSTSRTYAWYVYHPPGLDPSMTRGGPAVRNFGYQFLQVGWRADNRRPVVWGVDLRSARSLRTRGWGGNVSPFVILKPSPNVYVSLSPNYMRDMTENQYVATVRDPSNVAFAGTRVVFGTIDQTTVSLVSRLNVTFTPALSFELYAQPFASGAAYTSFREFTRPREDDVARYGVDAGTIAPVRDSAGAVTRYTIDPDGAAGAAAAFSVRNPDFTQRSLRGTAVLRWQYRPGSTVYFVWTQQRAGATSQGVREVGEQFRGLLGDRPADVFQVKATYWIGR